MVGECTLPMHTNVVSLLSHIIIAPQVYYEVVHSRSCNCVEQRRTPPLTSFQCPRGASDLATSETLLAATQRIALTDTSKVLVCNGFSVTERNCSFDRGKAASAPVPSRETSITRLRLRPCASNNVLRSALAAAE